MTNTKYKTPALWRRFAAMVYDFLLIVALSFLYMAIVNGITVAITGHQTGSRIADQWGIFKYGIFIGWLLTIIGFFCFFWKKSGQTLGMKTWHLKIINNNNQHPDYRQGFLRCLIAPISLLFFGLGYWWIYFNSEHQTLHDQLTKTKTILLK
jgi:uncharacterized RDD family membrane protein YckC